MHDHGVVRAASYPHNQPFLHPLLHTPWGPSLHPPRALSHETSLPRAEFEPRAEANAHTMLPPTRCCHE
jgi:hypothetical protein